MAISGAAFLNLAFLLSLAWVFASQQFFYSVSAAMVAIFWLPLIAIVLTAAGMFGAFRGWSRMSGRGRWLHLLLLPTLWLFPAFLARWNLLGFYF